jgi:hypothetical protein
MNNTAPNTINPVPVMTIIVQRRPVIKGRFFHGTPINNKFFLIVYKLVQENPDFSNDNDPDYHLNYDHEFLYPYNTLNYYVRCKLLSHSTIKDLLNKEEFDMNARNNVISLSPQQRLILEESLFVKLYLLFSKETDEIIMY